MNQLTDFLQKQTADTYGWTNKLVENITFDKWFITPEILETNLAWQVGHLTLSQYYYTIVLLIGPKKDFAESINLKKYSGLFSNGQRRKELISEITVQELLDNWKSMQTLTNETLTRLQDTDLNHDIFSMPKPHPFVKTKENAISWNVKHTMWHCGQIAMLKRVIDKPFDFGM
jgi:DinB superfamily